MSRNKKDGKKLDRRRFLKLGTLLPVVGLGFPHLRAAESCQSTTAEGAGPFFQPDAPFRTQLASPLEPGERLVISGKVADCTGPVPGAVVEIWQANTSGCYSVNEDCGVIPGDPDDFRLRGRFKTDAQGRYQFSTVKPAAYKAGGGFRPSHIHYKITPPPSESQGSADWISQLYFEGDQYNATDPIGGASLPEAKSRIIPLSKDSVGTLQGVFDIVLPSLPAADRSAHFSLQGHDLAIQRFHRMVRFFVPEEFYGGILGVYSHTGSRLREWAIVDHLIQWKTDDVPRGTYLVRLISHLEIEQAVHFQL